MLVQLCIKNSGVNRGQYRLFVSYEPYLVPLKYMTG